MKNRSTMTWGEYGFSVFWKTLIGFIYYKNTMFRTWSNHSTHTSLAILFLMISVSIISSIIFLYWKTGWLSTATIVLPLGVYTIMTYSAAFKTEILITLIITGIIAFSLLALMLSVKTKRSDHRIKKYIHRFYRCMYSVLCISTVTFFSLMVWIGGHKLLGTSMISPPTVKANITEESSRIVDMNILSNLIPNRWEKLSTGNRLDILQTICNVEVAYLGISTPITVEADNLSESIRGSYCDQMRLIQINLDHLEKDLPQSILHTLLHEIHHGYSARLAELYNSISPEAKKLRIFYDSSFYAQEVANYIDPKDNYDQYLAQKMEMNAEIYAKMGVKEYYDRIQHG